MFIIKGMAVEGLDRPNNRSMKFEIIEIQGGDQKHIGHIGFADGCLVNNFWTEKYYCTDCKELIGSTNRHNSKHISFELQFPKGFKESVIRENIFELTAVV